MLRRTATLQQGESAPDFTLPSNRGELQSLRDFLARGSVLLVFHRGTWWPNCQRRFGELAGSAAALQARGYSIVAVLAQKASAVRRYVEERGLPFLVLVDEDREVTKRYGVWNRINYDAWNIARPAVFVIRRDGTITAIFVGETQAEFPTPEEILTATAE